VGDEAMGLMSGRVGCKWKARLGANQRMHAGCKRRLWRRRRSVLRIAGSWHEAN